jgi:hypothetical protein
MAVSDVQFFHNRDEAYEAWRASPGGYVLTPPGSRRRSETKAYMLHESQCGHLSNLKGDLSVTRRPKRCGSRPDLIEWAQIETGSPPIFCPDCM